MGDPESFSPRQTTGGSAEEIPKRPGVGARECLTRGSGSFPGDMSCKVLGRGVPVERRAGPTYPKLGRDRGICKIRRSDVIKRIL